MMRAASALSALFGALAALFWLRSAQVPTPAKFPEVTATPIEGIRIGNSKELQELADALQRQSKLSAVAATFAALSVALQAVGILL